MPKSALAYVPESSWIHSLNPMTLITYVLTITVLGLAVSQIWILALLFLMNIILVKSAKVLKNFMYMFVRVTLPIVIPLLIVHTLFNNAGVTILYQVGPLKVRYEGLMFALNIIFRLLPLLSAYFLFVLVVSPRRLMIALYDRGVSAKIGYLVLSTLQLVPYIEQTAQRILDAQRSRGLSLKGSLIKRFKSYLPLITPVVVGGFSSLEIRAMAIEVRGISIKTKRIYLTQVPDRKLDKILRWVIIASAVALLVFSVVQKYFLVRSML